VDLRVTEIQGRVLVPGEATGPLLRLSKPISLWGGVEPTTGVVIDPRHPDHGTDIAGSILVLPATIGSSSSSAIMFELMRHNRAPAAVVLGRVDAILTLGVVVGRELGYPPLPVVEIRAEEVSRLPKTGTATVTAEGRVLVE
jgi:predicted aconitase with swiveling domain